MDADDKGMLSVNPPLAGGVAKNAPPHLANFLNNLKTSGDIDAKLTVPYTASN